MKLMKRVLSACLALVLILSGVCTAMAEDGNVIYDGDAGEFIFTPGSAFSPTDLFPNFKDVMPGDEIHQRILIENDADKDIKIKVYMRALGAHEDSEEFLSQLSLRVDQITESNLFAAPADETAQLTDWVYLGTIYSGGVIELDVTLEVPVTLDNSFKDLVGYLDWEFKIEEFPVEEEDPDGPAETGDDTNLILYIVATMASGAILLMLILWGIRRKKEQDDDEEEE